MSNGYDTYVSVQTLSGVFSDAAPSSDATECLLYDSFSADVDFEEMMCSQLRNSRVILDKKYGTETIGVTMAGGVNLEQNAWIQVMQNMFNAGYDKTIVDGETAVWTYEMYPAAFTDSNYLSVESYRGAKLHKYYPVKFTGLSLTSSVNSFIKYSLKGIAQKSAAPADTSETPVISEECSLSFKNCSITIGEDSYPVTDLSIDIDLNEVAAYVLGTAEANKVRPAGQIAPVAVKLSLLDYTNALHANYLTHTDSSLSVVVEGEVITGSALDTKYKMTISIPKMVWDGSKFPVSDAGPIKHDLEFKGLYYSDGATAKLKAPINIQIVSGVDL